MSHSFAIDIVEEDVQLTLGQLCRATRAPEGQVHTWVVEGVLVPEGATPAEWRFHGAALRRARRHAHARTRDQHARRCARARFDRGDRVLEGDAAAAALASSAQLRAEWRQPLAMPFNVRRPAPS
jgi:hypothetical protein